MITFIGDSKSHQRKSHADKGVTRIIETNSLISSVFAVAKQLGNRHFKNALDTIYISPKVLLKTLQKEWEKLQKYQKYIRALYTGGTFTYETQVVLNYAGLKEVYSNTPIKNSRMLPNSSTSLRNSIIDLGDENLPKAERTP